jgi:hypothetical protein
MGMRGRLRSITRSEMDWLQSNPDEVQSFIQGSIQKSAAGKQAALERAQAIAIKARAEVDLSNPAEQEKVRAQILKELAAGGIHVQGRPKDGGQHEDGLNLEKSWQVLHYLLTGHAEEAPPPLGNAILGGTAIGDDLDYGPVRFLTPDQVREVATALASVTKEDLKQRFNLKAMIAAHIYPVRDESELELAQDYFDELSHYYTDAAANASAMLLWIE